jgi:hypothetical protein
MFTANYIGECSGRNVIGWQKAIGDMEYCALIVPEKILEKTTGRWWSAISETMKLLHVTIASTIAKFAATGLSNTHSIGVIDRKGRPQPLPVNNTD